jgi:hypothetical protein
MPEAVIASSIFDPFTDPHAASIGRVMTREIITSKRLKSILFSFEYA